MAYTKRYNKPLRRRRPYRRRAPYRKKYVRPRKPLQTLMPKTFIRKLKYAAVPKLLTTNLQGIAYYTFSANGLFDPDISGAGHQPRGFDQLMTLYDHYTVLGCKITAKFQTPSSDVNDFICGIALADNASFSISQPRDFLENSYGNSKPLNGGAGAMSTTVTKYVSIRKFLGRSKPLSDPQLKGDNTSNPTEQAYIACWVIDTGLVGLLNAYVQATLEYIVVFHEPRLPPIS